MSKYHSDHHSGLEVVTPDAPQVAQNHFLSDPSQAPQVVPSSEKLQLYAKDYQHNDPEHPSKDAEAHVVKVSNDGKVLGLRKATFWLVVTIAIIILGGAIGGGVGAAVAKKKKPESSQSASTSIVSTAADSSSSPHPYSSTVTSEATRSATLTTSSSVSTASPHAQALVAGCPTVNNTIYTASTGRDRFLKVCDLEMPGPAIDITSYNTTTFDACIDKCAQLNFDTRNSSCVAVTWDLRAFDYKICYLKHTIGAWRTQASEDSYLVTGLLIGR